MRYEREILSNLYSVLDYLQCNNGSDLEVKIINKRIIELETEIKKAC